MAKAKSPKAPLPPIPVPLPDDAQFVPEAIQRRLIRCWAEGVQLSTGQLAKIFKYSPRKVSGMIDDKLLKGERVSGSQDRRVSVGDLLAFVRQDNKPRIEKLLLWAAKLAGVDPDKSRSYGNSRVVMLSDRPAITELGAGLLQNGADIPHFDHPVLVGLALQTDDLTCVIVDTATTFSSGTRTLLAALRKARPGVVIFVGIIDEEMRSEFPDESLFEAVLYAPFSSMALQDALRTASTAGIRKLTEASTASA